MMACTCVAASQACAWHCGVFGLSQLLVHGIVGFWGCHSCLCMALWDCQGCSFESTAHLLVIDCLQRPQTATAETAAAKVDFFSSASRAPPTRPQTAAPSHRAAWNGRGSLQQHVAPQRPQTAIPAYRASLDLGSSSVGAPLQLGASGDLPVSPVRDRLKHAVHRESALRCVASDTTVVRM